MKITELTEIKEIKLTKEVLTQYKNQTNTRRKKEIKGGYDYILSTTDADLD